MKFKSEWHRLRYEKAEVAYDELMKVYPFSVADEPGEEWLPIYDDYQVSNYGRTKSFKRSKPKILKPRLSKDGYLRVRLNIDGKPKYLQVHVLVARAFIPNPLNKPEVNHHDGDKFNCRVSNLYWATHEENMQHAVKTGLIKSGADNYNAKLTDEQILYIRENPDSLTTVELAEKFGVAESTIGKIQRGERYKNEGGTVRKPLKQRISDEIRNQIRIRFATGDYTKAALAREYNVGEASISRILRETS